jgi:hypothetical protein
MRRSIEAALVAALLCGCTTLPWKEEVATETPVSSAVWVQNPRAYAEEVASASAQERARLREEALGDFLQAPSAEQQLRLTLVFDAATHDLADGYAAADSLAHALGTAPLPPEARAVLQVLMLRTERRVDYQRAIASRDSELAAVRDAYDVLEQGKAASDTQTAIAQRALKEAQAKLDALKSIERTLESNSTQAPVPEVEPPREGAP